MRSSRLAAPAVVLAATLCVLAGPSGCDHVKSWRMQQNDQVVHYVPPPEEYCYRTLADVDCYPKPDKRDSARRVQ